MPQRNDEEGDKQPRLPFSPAASVWGQMGRAWTSDRRNPSRTKETITVEDYVAFFHQYFGFTNHPVLAPFANEQCRCICCGRLRELVTTEVSPPNTRWCSRVISKSFS
jgi:hypothetical protein